MPWSPRVVVGEGIYHVYARGNNLQVIFLDNVDRLYYLRRLGAAFRLLDIRLLAYVLMSTHVHLVVQVATPNLDVAIHRVHQHYAFRFNRRHRRIGHAFNNRFQSRPITNDSYLLQATRYVHLNPVEAGLVAHPREYPWSSYHQYVTAPQPGQIVDPRLVLSLFGEDQVQCRIAYEESVTADLKPERRRVIGRAEGLSGDGSPSPSSRQR